MSSNWFVLCMFGLCAALAPVSCTVGEDRVKRILSHEGVEDIDLDGYAYFGCGGDIFRSSFTGKRRGHGVSGQVCCGLLKSCTVRYE